MTLNRSISSARRVFAALVLLCALGSAIGAAVLLVWWNVRPSQVVVELTRYAYVWVGAAGWLSALLGWALTRGRVRRATTVALAAGLVVGLLLWSGPGSVTSQSEVVVRNTSGATVTNVRVQAGGDDHAMDRLPDGQSWTIVLTPDVAGAFRVVATDADGAVVSARSLLVDGEPDRISVEVRADGVVSLRTRSLRTRLTRRLD